MSEGVVFKLRGELSSTRTPHLILAQIFSELFNRKLRKTEWPQLGKLVKVYGRWVVLQSLILAASNSNFDASKNPWGYFSKICMNIFNDDIALIEANRLQKQQSDNTLEFINSLYERKITYTLKVKEEWLS